MSSTETKDKATMPESVKRPDFLEKSEYYRKILEMQKEYPHLRSLSLYMEMSEKLRIEGKLGSHSSDSILLANISYESFVVCHRIDCYENEQPLDSVDSGWFELNGTSARVVILEDLSPAAIDALGMRFDIDPHIFYYHLGLDSQTSTVSRFAATGTRNTTIPTKMCMEAHAPQDFISIPIPYDFILTANMQTPAGATKAYSQIEEYSTIAKFSDQGSSSNKGDTVRLFHHLSVIYPQIRRSIRDTVIIFAFPTWHQALSDVDEISRTEVPNVDFGLNFKSWRPNLPISKNAWYKNKKGIWDRAQWERAEPMFRSLVLGIDPEFTRGGRKNCLLGSIHDIHPNAKLWLYSVIDKIYNLSLETESRCWQQTQNFFHSSQRLELSHQYPKRHLRESIIKTIHFLETAQIWLNGVISSHYSTSLIFRAGVEVTLKAKKALVAEIQRSIDDYQGEAEMKLIIAKLKRMMTPPSSPVPKPEKDERIKNILGMLERAEENLDEER